MTIIDAYPKSIITPALPQLSFNVVLSTSMHVYPLEKQEHISEKIFICFPICFNSNFVNIQVREEGSVGYSLDTFLCELRFINKVLL